ncbi:hypothetical protein JCM10207_000135 [Rhodosporidiobolus poonsookiae]
MHVPLSLLASAALLGTLAAAAPLPGAEVLAGASASASASAASSCVCESAASAEVGIAAKLREPLKVKQGDQRRCPQGWTRSHEQVGLCIEVGGHDHKEEQKHLGKIKAAKTTSHSRLPTASPRVKNAKEDNEHREHRPKKSSSTTQHRAAANTPASTPRKKCPEGQTLDGALLDLCVDIDTDPLYIGAGIKIGHGSPTTTPTRSNAYETPRARKGEVSPKGAKKADGKDCPEGQTAGGALLDLCVDIDTAPLHLGAGIKIGSGPATPTTRARNGEKTPAPARGGQKQDDTLPPCGKDDPLALLDLCIQVGDLLGVKAKVGGSDDSDDEDWGAFRGGNGVKLASTTQRLSSPTTAARARQTTAANRMTKAADNKKLPACDGNDDPRAVLNLCVKVGAGKDPLVGVGATVLGSQGTKAKVTVGDATLADVSLDHNGLKADVPGVLKIDTTADGQKEPSSGLLNVDVGGLLKAQVLAASPVSAVTTAPKNVHQAAPVRGAASDATDKPLVSAKAAVKVASKPNKACPPGELLHLGVCVKAKADVAGLVKTDAKANVGL